jgi:ParB family transcriptional regulator, chromosome partitioning protein
MARKNLLSGALAPAAAIEDRGARVDYAMRGASRAMRLSIDELAASANRLASGETIVELDPDLVDPSAVQDRIEDDEEEFALFRESIREQGQNQPILVRPSDAAPGRYVIVFGRRRARAARELGRPVLAVVKAMDETAHVIVQGQENTRRKDYSFIEKALFAQRLLQLGHSKDVAKAALSIDDSLLSRMLGIAEGVPGDVISAIGAARTVGRDRWDDLKRLITAPGAPERAREIAAAEEFAAADSVTRFGLIMVGLKSRSRRRKAPPAPVWTPPDNTVSAEWRATGKAFTLSLGEHDGRAFGVYISTHLDELYESFRRENTTTNPGD